MAIAPSKLGRLISDEWHSDDALIRRLRANGLVRRGASNDDLHAMFNMAREEHAALPEGQRAFNSPNERVRVFLAPFLSWKGKKWAVPLDSLEPGFAMKKYLIALLVGVVLTVVFGILAGVGGGACHCNTPLQVLFPYAWLLEGPGDSGILGTLLFALQYPIYAVSLAMPRRAAWQMGALLIVLAVHAGAIALT